jgi:hypothetical protein
MQFISEKDILNWKDHLQINKNMIKSETKFEQIILIDSSKIREAGS